MFAWCAADLEARPPADLSRLRPSTSRRELLIWASALFGCCLLPPGVRASDDLAFAAGSLEELLSALGGQPAVDPQVSLAVPDLVENGAIVPVEVTSRLPGAQTMYLVSESNPYPLVARFSFPDGTEPFLATRIKVAQSCNIYAIVKAADRLYWANKATQVTVGGCGG